MPEELTIDAKLLSETDKAWYLDCEGDKEWFPKSQCEYNESETALTAPKWLLEKKFPDEEW